MSSDNDIIWIEHADHYLYWSTAERTYVEQFLRDCGIDPQDVLISGCGGEMVVRLTPDGLRLSLWVVDGQDGKTVRCPSCPACVRQKQVTVPVTVPLPPRCSVCQLAALGPL